MAGKKYIYIALVLLIIIIPISLLHAEEQYLTGPGDILDISVWKDDFLSRQIPVPPDGTISYPLIGDIQATGLTIQDLEEEFAKRLSEYLPDTPVTVSVIATNSLIAYVIGKVNKPGRFAINLETDVMQILAMAGGLSPFADSKKILVLRRQDGLDVKLNFNYHEVKKGVNLEQNIILQRGDVIVVP